MRATKHPAYFHTAGVDNFILKKQSFATDLYHLPQGRYIGRFPTNLGRYELGYIYRLCHRK